MRNSKKANTRSVLMRDGSARRVSREVAERMIKNGQAVQYISHTVLRAIELGVEIEDASLCDDSRRLRERVQAAHERDMKRRKKEDAKRKKEEFDLLEDDAA